MTIEPVESELQIASFVILIKPELLTTVICRISALEGLEVYYGDSDGKIIATLECQSERQLARLTHEIQEESGVLSLNLVYHYIGEAA